MSIVFLDDYSIFTGEYEYEYNIWRYTDHDFISFDTFLSYL